MGSSREKETLKSTVLFPSNLFVVAAPIDDGLWVVVVVKSNQTDYYHHFRRPYPQPPQSGVIKSGQTIKPTTTYRPKCSQEIHLPHNTHPLRDITVFVVSAVNITPLSFSGSLCSPLNQFQSRTSDCTLSSKQSKSTHPPTIKSPPTSNQSYHQRWWCSISLQSKVTMRRWRGGVPLDTP